MVHVTNHQPLEMITRKPLNSAPNHLQRMLLQLQKYNLKVCYKKGVHMYLANTLNRAYLTEAQVCAVAQEAVEMDHTAMLVLLPKQILYSSYSKHRPRTRFWISSTRPSNRSGQPAKQMSEKCSYDIRDEITMQGSLIFKRASCSHVVSPTERNDGGMSRHSHQSERVDQASQEIHLLATNIDRVKGLHIEV